MKVIKPQKNKTPMVFSPAVKKQNTNNPTFQFLDNRPETIMQRKIQTMADNRVVPPLQEQKQLLRNNTGLPDNLKSGIESLSGYSLDDVKVHHNSDKPAQLHAHAYAQGTDIHLGPGQEKHLPHEAWHVVQQKQGRVKPTMQMKGANINDNSGLEKEADVMGAKALEGSFNRSNIKPIAPDTITTKIQPFSSICQLKDEEDEERSATSLAGTVGAIAETIGEITGDDASKALGSIMSPLADISEGIGDSMEGRKEVQNPSSRIEGGISLTSGLAALTSGFGNLTGLLPDAVNEPLSALSDVGGTVKKGMSAYSASGTQHQMTNLAQQSQQGGATSRTASKISSEAEKQKYAGLKDTFLGGVKVANALNPEPYSKTMVAAGTKAYEGGWGEWALRGIGSTLAPGYIDSNRQAAKKKGNDSARNNIAETILAEQTTRESTMAERQQLALAAKSVGRTKFSKDLETGKVHKPLSANERLVRRKRKGKR